MQHRFWPYHYNDQELKEIAVHILKVNNQAKEARVLEVILHSLTDRGAIIKAIVKAGIYVY
jgi:hypothetical protein